LRLFDHLVGERDERSWDFEADSSSGLRSMLGSHQLEIGQVYHLLDQLGAKTAVLGVGYRSRLL
jgi:hypothetical protein